MLIFEYTKLVQINSLVNHEPFIWKWVNPSYKVVSWWHDDFGMSTVSDAYNMINVIGARVNGTNLIFAENYIIMLSTPNSVYWDHTEQVAYLHLLENPIINSSIDLALLQGATNEDTQIINGVVYPNILVSKPTVSRDIEPINYTRMATQSINIELLNMEMYTIVNDKVTQYWLFDEFAKYEYMIAGQTTFLKYYDGEEIIMLHKGVVSDYTITPEKLKLVCADRRSKTDVEWPILTYEEAGYTDEDVNEDDLTKVIPDGFGYVKEAPLTCINRSYTIIQFDEDNDNEIILPTDQRLNWDMTTWTKSNIIVDKRETDKIGKFTSFRIAKTTATPSNYCRTTFIATNTTHKVSGYIRCEGEYNTPKGDTIVSVRIGASTVYKKISLKLSDQTYDLNGVKNGRVKYNVTDDGKITAYYSFEVENLIIGNSYTFAIYPDYTSQNESAIVVSATRVGDPVYPKFKIANVVTSVEKVFYEEDNEMIEIKDFLSLKNGVIELHDIDVHKEGLIAEGLIPLYCNAVLRPETNPMDIIIKLNNETLGYEYIPGLYDIETCDEEKTKLCGVALYKDSSEKLYSLIEELQSGSTVGFRYDDIDHIYIKCDDPNRIKSFDLIRGQIIDELECNANLTLYADTISVEYLPSRKDSDIQTYTNDNYKFKVLNLYSYENPMTVSSLIVNEQDAINKSVILLEDLSRARPIFTVRVHGIVDIDLYDIGMIDLSLSDLRTFAGRVRAQIIGIEVDTEFNITTLKLRERQYSSAFANITGSYGGAVVVPIGLNIEIEDESDPTAIMDQSLIIGQSDGGE